MACNKHPPECEHEDCYSMWERNVQATRADQFFQFQEWLAYCRMQKQPKHDSEMTGPLWMQELWNGNDNRFFEQFRMRKSTMANLIQLLQSRYGFVPYARVHAEESVGMFLHVIGHASTFTNITERFQRSGQTVSEHFHAVLDAVCRLGKEIIKPEDPTYTNTPEHILNSTRYYPYFAGCVGAIDGTHINVKLGDEHEIVPWINRKGVTTTNVLAAVDFNLCITYAKVGLEGSMHDSRILMQALRDDRRPFPRPPEGKYFLADSGYPNMKGFLTPYKRTRYHLPDFRQAGVIRNRNENFNYVHSSLRSVVERTFGVLKERFKILRRMTKFNLKTQIKIIWAAFALHNYLRRYDANDISLLQFDVDDERDDPNENQTSEPFTGQSRRDMVYMDQLRDRIRDMLDDRQILD